MGLRSSELIAIAYFAYLMAVAAVRRRPAGRRRRVIIICTAMISAVLASAYLPASPLAWIRDWLPLVVLLGGYWLPAQLVIGPNPALERLLLGFDRQIFGDSGLARFEAVAPRWLIECLELAYLFCYPIVPLGFLWLILSGFRGATDQYWTTVLVAAFVCYGLLPWLPTRPPRTIDGAFPISRSPIRVLNRRILNRASVQLNTFPSGHAATSVAIALVVGAHTPLAGALFGILAAGIIAGSVTGRYHYAADAVSGILVAIGAFAAAHLR